ncbi:MAG: hypothetical protein WC310_04900 [Patescibacteria group bacterium]|jgi:cell division protein FtsL
MTSRIQNKNTKQKERRNFSLNIKVFNIFFICLIVLGGFLYLTQVNSSAVKGYILRDLEIKLEDAKSSNRSLSLQVQELQSINGLTKKIETMGMVPTTDVAYLQMPGNDVAMAK